MKFKEYLDYHDVDVDVGTDITEHELRIIIPPPSNFKHELRKNESEENSFEEHVFTNTTGHLTTEIYLCEPLKSAFILQIDDRKEPPMDKTFYEISDAPPYLYF